MKSLSLPTSLVMIGNAAFYSSGGYPDLVIPTSVTFIDQVTFVSKLDYLAKIIIFVKSAFGSNPFLVNVSLPTSITEVSGSTFAYCSALSSIMIST